MKNTCFVLLLLLLTGCSALNREELVLLNNRIAATNDSLFTKGAAWGQELEMAWLSKDFSRADSMHRDIMAFIDRKMKELSQDNVAGGEALREAEIAFLRFEQEVMSPAKVFGSFDSSTTEETFSAAFLRLVEASKTEKTELEKVEAAQRTVLREHNIPLQKSRD